MDIPTIKFGFLWRNPNLMRRGCEFGATPMHRQRELDVEIGLRGMQVASSHAPNAPSL